jgi:putative pyruvate formate lyase activating enzyme
MSPCQLWVLPVILLSMAVTDDPDLLYRECTICGRKCGIDRTLGLHGFCGETSTMRIANAALHLGEEPVISGRGGSGAIFFTGCSLGCFFCQNYQISRGGIGRELPIQEFAELCLTLQDRSAENINLVTGTHFLPSISRGLSLAKSMGLSVPVVWNSSGYEKISSLSVLDGLIDVYLPDLKTLDSGTSRDLFQLPDYPEQAKAALLRLTAGRELIIENGLMKRGTLVRHLVLPGLLESTRGVLKWYSENLKERALLSLLFQYLPVGGEEKKDFSRSVANYEYEKVINMLYDYKIDDGFIQDSQAAAESWMPDFRKINPFPEGCAIPVWSSLRAGAPS